jgi:hypothetical protein
MPHIMLRNSVAIMHVAHVEGVWKQSTVRYKSVETGQVVALPTEVPYARLLLWDLLAYWHPATVWCTIVMSSAQHISAKLNAVDKSVLQSRCTEPSCAATHGGQWSVRKLPKQ